MREIMEVQEIDKLEREKSPEEVEIVNGILKHMPEFIIKYGGNPVVIK